AALSYVRRGFLRRVEGGEEGEPLAADEGVCGDQGVAQGLVAPGLGRCRPAAVLRAYPQPVERTRTGQPLRAQEGACLDRTPAAPPQTSCAARQLLGPLAAGSAERELLSPSQKFGEWSDEAGLARHRLVEGQLERARRLQAVHRGMAALLVPALHAPVLRLEI